MTPTTNHILREAVAKAASLIVSENRAVTFNGRTYPRFGWTVILAGGGGSGKGFQLNRTIPIDGKVINVDDYKAFFARMRGIDMDAADPEQMNMIHMGVKRAGWKQKATDNILSPETHSPDRLPNVIFDMTGRDPSNTVVDVAAQAKDSGYQVMLIWIVANRSEALLRNLQRPRHVPDRVLHQAHNSLHDDMPPFLRSRYAGMYLDDAWVIYGSLPDISASDITGEDAKHIAVRLNRKGEGFDVPADVERRIYGIMGRNEANPLEPETYLTSTEIADRYGTPIGNGRYRIDRTKVKDFYRR